MIALRTSARAIVRLRRDCTRRSVPSVLCATDQRRMMAKAGPKKGDKGGGKGQGAGSGDAKDDGMGEHGLGTVPINYLKDGKDPSIMPDDQYPDWLWNMKLPSLARLGRKREDDLTLDESRRFVQLDAREKIKRQNRSGRF